MHNMRFNDNRLPVFDESKLNDQYFIPGSGPNDGRYPANVFANASDVAALGTKTDNISGSVDNLESKVIDGLYLIDNVSVANNAVLNYTKKLDSDYIWLQVNADFMSTYRVYYKDSNGVKSDYTADTQSYEVGKPQLVNLRKGYDTIWLYGYGQTNTSGTAKTVTINKYVAPLEPKSKEYGVELSGVDVVMDVKVENSNRLTRYIKFDTAVVNFKLDIIKGSYPNKYKVYFADSTGVNADSTSNTTSYEFGKYYSVTIPTGYDSLWFFCGTYNNSGSEVIISVGVWKDGTLNKRVTEIEGAIDVMSPFKGKSIVCFGDSITAFSQNGKSYPDYLRNLSGATVLNAGIGGTRFSERTSQTTTPATENKAYAALDICNLVHSWCNADWSYVDPAVTYLDTNSGTHLADKIAALKATPIADVDVVTIMAGTNDFAFEVGLGTSGSTDKSTVFGGINSIIQDILAANPKIRIFMFSPTIRWFRYSGTATSDPDDFSDVKQKGGMTLKEFSAAIMEEIEKSHIPVCDMYNTLGWNKWNFSNYFVDTDGTHPYKGFENIANRFYAFLIAMNN